MGGSFKTESHQSRWTVVLLHEFKVIFETVIVSYWYFVLLCLLSPSFTRESFSCLVTISKVGNSLWPSWRDSFSRLVSGVTCSHCVYWKELIVSPLVVQFVRSRHVAKASIWHCNICWRCLLRTASTPSRVRALISLQNRARMTRNSPSWVSRIGTAVSSRWNSCVTGPWFSSLAHCGSLGNKPAVQCASTYMVRELIIHFRSF